MQTLRTALSPGAPGAVSHGRDFAKHVQVQSRGTGRGMNSACRAGMSGKGTFIVGGNWKNNGSVAEITALVDSLNSGTVEPGCEVVCAPPYVYMAQVMGSLKAPFEVAAQNCWIGKGAFTGEVAGEMLTDLGVPWVILGHSERRSLLGEDNKFVGEKCAHALSLGLKVIACVGETLEQRESGTTMDVVHSQLAAIAAEIDDWSKVVVAYEPVWAIGTGKVATPEQAQEVHAGIRAWVASNVSQEVADAVRIQYGGSVNGGNCDELAKQEDIDGFLVGGASLKGDEFVTICNAAAAHYAAVKATAT